MYKGQLHYMSEWWKQLYGESEGKDGKGIFPASVLFTTDLHSMGQYIQDGERMLMETVVTVEKASRSVIIESDEQNLDGLNFLAGKRVDEVNKMAELGTQLAHVDGGVPNIKISIDKLDEYHIGQLIYICLLYTSDAADEEDSLDLGGQRNSYKTTTTYST